MADQKTFHLNISRVDGPVFEGDVFSVTVPGASGEMTILANHEPIISPLKKGVIMVRDSDGTHNFEVESGILELSNNQVVILV